MVRKSEISPSIFCGGNYKSTGNNDDTGAVHTYSYDGALWHYTGTITTASGVPSDRFGTALSVSGNVAFIGSPGNEEKGCGIYLFLQ